MAGRTNRGAAISLTAVELIGFSISHRTDGGVAVAGTRRWTSGVGMEVQVLRPSGCGVGSTGLSIERFVHLAGAPGAMEQDGELAGDSDDAFSSAMSESAARVLLEIEGPHKEDGHLAACTRTGRTVVRSAAACRYALVVELFNPVNREAGSWVAFHIGEDARADWRNVGRTTLGSEQEDGHLSASDSSIRAIVPAAAPRGDSLDGELLDPVSEGPRTRSIAKEADTGRRNVARTMLALQKKHRHLGSAHGIVPTIVARADACRDVIAENRFDVRMEYVCLRYVEKVGQPPLDHCGRRTVGIEYQHVVEGPRRQRGSRCSRGGEARNVYADCRDPSHRHRCSRHRNAFR